MSARPQTSSGRQRLLDDVHEASRSLGFPRAQNAQTQRWAHLMPSFAEYRPARSTGKKCEEDAESFADDATGGGEGRRKVRVREIQGPVGGNPQGSSVKVAPRRRLAEAASHLPPKEDILEADV